ncbi:MAG: undecaprenyldiphospho-muramoylpentapeptide beta-N-acetylglucosaminyltransferase [Eubacteriaceae bacterium]|nr:undecaprenyldiphospho-muramoylpentapeptide beta-N-acetylglucosaminyltransferase [Eubacteriaceae bacterium]
MKVLIAAGGTGGHIYPGIAIANIIKKNHPDAEIRFVGTSKGMEKDIVPAAGYPISMIRVKGFERKLSMDTLKSVGELFKGLADARKLVKDFKPDITIGTGGYVCGPILFIAARMGIPTLIHEQNAFPGATNKLLARFVDRVAISFEESIKYFHHAEKLFLSGNPIRQDFFAVDKMKARKKLEIPQDSRLIVSVGGSQGALTINTAMMEVIKEYKDNKNVYVVHVTGKKQYAAFTLKMKEIADIEGSENIRILAYSNDMPDLLNGADLVVSRAGAMSVAEIAAASAASILVPFPFATDNHQEYNARTITENGGGMLILDKALKDDPKLLTRTVDMLISSPDRLAEMSTKAKETAVLNSDVIIYEKIKELLEGKYKK